MLTMEKMTDNELIAAIFSGDPAIGLLAKRLFDARYDARHSGKGQPKEPAHCSECFEGCPKCQPIKAEGPSIRDLREMIGREI